MSLTTAPTVTAAPLTTSTNAIARIDTPPGKFFFDPACRNCPVRS